MSATISAARRGRLRFPTIDQVCRTLFERSWTLRHHLTFTVTLDTPTGPLRVPIVNGLGSLYLRVPQEPWMPGLIGELHRFRPGSFVDVGANLGQTLTSLLAVDREIAYLGCEPLSAEVDFIRRLIDLNGLAHHRVYPVALGRDPGAARIHIGEQRRASTLRVTDWFRAVGESDVLVMRGDDLLRQAGVDDATIIKIDVEGFELHVVDGLRDSLARMRPFIIFEVLPFDLGDVESADLARALECALAEAGYAFRHIVRDGRLSLVASILSSYDISGHAEVDFDDANYLAVPIEFVADFDRHHVAERARASR